MDKKLSYNFLFAVSWAGLIFNGKLALNSGVVPLAYTFQFMFLTSILLSLYLAITSRADLKKISRKDLPLFLAVGILVAVAFITGGTYGLKLTSSINYSLVSKSDLIFMPLMGYVFLKEKIVPRTIPLMVALVFGLYLLLTSGRPIIPNPGDLLTLLGIFLYSLAAITQKSLVKRLSPAIVGWVRITFAVVMMAPIIPFIEPAFLQPSDPVFIVAGALVNTFLAIFINRALSVSSASFYGIASMTVPVLVSILGVVFLHETLTPIQLLGAVIILVSGFMANLWKI